MSKRVENVVRKLRFPAMGETLLGDLLWAVVLFLLIMASIVFYTGAESRFVYTDF